MGLSRLSLLLLLVIVAGVLAVIALPGGGPGPVKRVLSGHPWLRFSEAGGAFTTPEGWSSRDPYSPTGLAASLERCSHQPPTRTRAALLSSPDRQVSVWLASGPRRVMRAALAAGAGAPDQTGSLPLGAAPPSSGPSGLAITWHAGIPEPAAGGADSRCAFGIATSEESAFLIHVAGRLEADDLEAISFLLKTLRLPAD
ncbi:MAG: hypothetical protein V2A76_04255 [Planctomycetota bacterium]